MQTNIQSFNNLTWDILLSPQSFGLFMRDIEEASLNLKTAIYNWNVNLTADLYKQLETLSSNKYNAINTDWSIDTTRLSDTDMIWKDAWLYMNHQRMWFWDWDEWMAVIWNTWEMWLWNVIWTNYLYWDWINLNIKWNLMLSSWETVEDALDNIDVSRTALSGKPYFLDTNIAPTWSWLKLTSTYMWFYNWSQWRTYMDNSWNFYLSWTWSNGLSWNWSSLNITGNITLTNTIPNTSVSWLWSLATQSSVSYWSLTWTKPPENADVTLSAIQWSLTLTWWWLVLASWWASIRWWMTWYNTWTWFWLWDNWWTTKLSIWNSSWNKLTWDWSSLNITGNINMTWWSVSWSYITWAPTIPTLPSYITSTKITSTTIESPTITWWTIRTSSGWSRVEMNSELWILWIDRSWVYRTRLTTWWIFEFRTTWNSLTWTLEWANISRPVVWWTSWALYNSQWAIVSNWDLIAAWSWNILTNNDVYANRFYPWWNTSAYFSSAWSWARPFWQWTSESWSILYSRWVSASTATATKRIQVDIWWTTYYLLATL